MFLIQSFEADLNWLKLVVETTEAGNKFHVRTDRGKKE